MASIKCPEKATYVAEKNKNAMLRPVTKVRNLTASCFSVEVIIRSLPLLGLDIITCSTDLLFLDKLVLRS